MAQTLINKSQTVKAYDGYDGYVFRLEVIMNSYNATNSTYNVTINHHVYGISGHIYHGVSGPTSAVRAYVGSTMIVESVVACPAIRANETTIGSWTGNIQANADGNLTVRYVAKYTPNKTTSYLPKTNSIEETIAMPTIPRYASITKYVVSQRDETSLSVSWSANVSCNAVQYRIRQSGGSFGNWTNASGNNFNISGLNPGITYITQIQVRRSDSGLWTSSGDYRQATYNYPYVTSIEKTELLIGESQRLNIYNPLHRTISIGMKKNDMSGETLFYRVDETTGETYLFTPNAEVLYNSIPNAIESDAIYYCSYNGNIYLPSGEFVKGKYKLDINESKPTFEDFDYSTNLSELTGNNDTIINGQTTVTFSIPVSKKAIGVNGATVQRYSVECGSQTTLVNYSEDEAVSVSLPKCTTNIIKVTAIDNRGLETTVSKEVTNFLTYYAPTFESYNVDRENGIDSTAYLDTKIHFWNYSFGLTRNDIRYLKYRIKESENAEWSEWFDADVSEFVINREEAVLTNGLIYSDGLSAGFTIGKKYILQLQVIDGTNNITLSGTMSGEFILSDGKIALSILKDRDGDYHIGINGMPDLNNTLKIHGTISSDS